MDEERLRKELNELTKERLIELFIKLKKVNLKLCDRLEKAENQLDELIDVDSLIESLPDV